VTAINRRVIWIWALTLFPFKIPDIFILVIMCIPQCYDTNVITCRRTDIKAWIEVWTESRLGV